ncbi:hypothetical protein AC579_8203 [Pseudocercospora musae]|uniref:Carboxylesterase type B domain-containing protein n=1 Tax=Pseudocercospora musae TaxID=113226 RepID=A0A139IVQ3_9PEZI|nr:hypothetical protein AC579_8203 [Pseudocercospora musae]
MCQPSSVGASMTPISSNIAKFEDLSPPSDLFFPNGTTQQPVPSYRGSRLFRDIGFVCQPFLIGEALANSGNNVYFYNQNQSISESILHTRAYCGCGVVHTSELAYVFGNFSHYFMHGFNLQPTLSDVALRWEESRSWTSFVAVGHPSKGEYGQSAPDHGVFTIGGTGHSGSGGSEKARKVLDSQKPRERCGFLYSPEVPKQLLY